MATTLPTPKPAVWNRSETDREIRHPLSAIRGYIRSYVVLEGVALTLLFLGLWFWIGLGLDWALHYFLNFDWIKVLDMAAGLETAFWFRAVLLGVILVGLLAVVALTIFRRLFFEFADGAVAMVLERRYPRELGDRLITALELANPELSKKYGYSQAMVDQTIISAAERVARLPVAGVFNWSRLIGTWVLAVTATLGIYLIACGTLFAFGLASDTTGNVHQLHRSGWLWTNRNIALADRYYWPTRSYLEVVRFQNDPEHPHKTVIGKDVGHSDFRVKAYEWVIFDPEAEAGIRPLLYSDLSEWVVDNKAVLDLKMPANWEHWIMDLDDLNPEIPFAVIPSKWDQQSTGLVHRELQGRVAPEQILRQGIGAFGMSDSFLSQLTYQRLSITTAAKERAETIKKDLTKANAMKDVEKLLDWRYWTVDKIFLQKERVKSAQDEKIRKFHTSQKALRTLREKVEDVNAEIFDELEAEFGPGPEMDLARKDPEVLEGYRDLLLHRVRQRLKYYDEEILRALAINRQLVPIDNLRKELESLAESPSTSWNIRKLTLPESVRVNYWGRTVQGDNAFLLSGGKYYIGLDKLTESVKFRVFGEDYYTPTLEIELASPPMFTHLAFQQLQPAYIHHTLADDQSPLAGKKQKVHINLDPPSGDSEEISVPEGTELDIVVIAERPLKEGILVVAPPKRKYENSIKPDVEPVFTDGTRTTFKLPIGRVNQSLEFQLVYVDKYNIEGRHTFAINLIKERAPSETSDFRKISMLYLLKEFSRDFRDPKTGKDHEFITKKGEPLAGYLVTPSALLEFGGIMKDDYGLTHLEWAFEIEQLEFELEPASKKDKEAETPQVAKPVEDTAAKDLARRLGIVLWPLSAAAPGGVTAPGMLEAHLSQSVFLARYDLNRGEAWARLHYIPMREFGNKLDLVYQNAYPYKTQNMRDKFAQLLQTPITTLDADAAESLAADAKTNSLLVVSHILADLTEKAGPNAREETAHLHLEHDISTETGGFDLERNFPGLTSGKLHYRLKIKVAATDNNVDTGPNITYTKEFTFLVVTELDLIALMLKKQEILRQDLENVQTTLTNLKPGLTQAIDAITNPDSDVETIEIEAKGIAATVEKQYREAKAIYEGIDKMLKQMVTNRIKGDFAIRLEENVHEPLRKLLDEKNGAFAELQNSSKNFWKKLELDVMLVNDAKEKKLPLDVLEPILKGNRFDHAINARAVESDLDRVNRELQQVINAISGQLKEKEVYELLVKNEKEQRRLTELLREIHGRITNDLLGELIGGDPKKAPEKKK
jgi:hypothetical protein